MCKSEPVGGDAVKAIVSYSKINPPIFVNLNAVQCVVGHVDVADKRLDTDWSWDFARTVFEDSDDVA
jgi:hypothetical protein